MALSVATLNVNGLNNVNKQMKVVSLIKYYKIDILLVQEHNVKDISVLSYLSNFTEIVLNPTTNLKGGTMICINKKTDVKLLTKEMDSSGRIVAIKVFYKKMCNSHC